MVAPHPKYDLLNNIELLWKDASIEALNNGVENPTSQFHRIDILMQDALAVEQDTKTMLPDQPHTAAQDTLVPTPMVPIDDISALAKLVDHAATKQKRNSLEKSPKQASFDQIMSQMDDVSRLKPPHEDNYNISSVEYDFGEEFTNLVRNGVRDYIHNEVEDVIRHAIKSELHNHFERSQGNNDTRDEKSKTI